MRTDIDVTFDFRRDTPEGKDPDTHSKTLRLYHRLLWSKRLPGGELFRLDDAVPRHYLHHQSSLGDFSLTSDAVIPTFKGQGGETVSDKKLLAQQRTHRGPLTTRSGVSWHGTPAPRGVSVAGRLEPSSLGKPTLAPECG